METYSRQALIYGVLNVGMTAYEMEKYRLCLEREQSLTFMDQASMWWNNEQLVCPTPETLQMTIVRNLIQTGTVLAVEICIIVTWRLVKFITRKLYRFFRPVECLDTGISPPANEETLRKFKETETHNQAIALTGQTKDSIKVNQDRSCKSRFISWLSSRVFPDKTQDSSYISRFWSWYNAEKKYTSPKSILFSWFTRGKEGEINSNHGPKYPTARINHEGKGGLPLNQDDPSLNENKYVWLSSLRSRISSMVLKQKDSGKQHHVTTKTEEEEEKFEDALEEDPLSLKILYEYIKYGVLPKYSVDHLLKILEEKHVPLPEKKTILVDLYRIALKKRAAHWGLTLRSRARKILTARPFRRFFPPGKLYGALGFKRKRDRFFDAYEEIPEDELNAGDQGKQTKAKAAKGTRKNRAQQKK